MEWLDIPLAKIYQNYITNRKKYIYTILSSSIDEFRLKCLSLCDLRVFQSSTSSSFHKEPKIQVMIEIAWGRIY